MTTSRRMEIPTPSREVLVAVHVTTHPEHTTMVLDGRFKQVLGVDNTTPTVEETECMYRKDTNL